MKNYETEARSRWGATDAYREHEQKTKNYTKEKWAEANDDLMAVFAEFAACKDSGASADSAEAQALVAKLQAHITANYYTCTDEILAGLGKMYVTTSDSRRTSTSMAMEQPSLFVLQSAIAAKNKMKPSFDKQKVYESANDEPDKFAKAGFHATKSEYVNAPIIEELPMTVECKLIKFNEDGICIGEIINVSADESVLDKNGKVNVKKLDPIIYDGVTHAYWSFGEKVGQAFSDGKKIK